jgi:hypothetical protein
MRDGNHSKAMGFVRCQRELSKQSEDSAMTTAHDAVRKFGANLVPQAASFKPTESRLDKRLVHKSHDESVVVSHIEAVPPPETLKRSAENPGSGRTDHFRAVLRMDRDHPLFFDRDCGHVHAICLMEAVQQTSIAIAHLFYGVPLDVECVHTECSAQFRSMATMDDPLIVEQIMSGHIYRRGRLVRMQAVVVIRQGNLERARFTGTAVLLRKEQLKYLEERAAAGDLPNQGFVQPAGDCS